MDGGTTVVRVGEEIGIIYLPVVIVAVDIKFIGMTRL